MKQKKILIWGFFILLSILFLTTRLWQLNRLPTGLHVDEAGMAYDAWSLSQFGTDRYGKSLPVYLANFGTGQSALYAYVCALFIKLIGYNIWAIRLPAVLFSAINLFFGCKLAEKLLVTEKDVKPADVLMVKMGVGILFTICPYYILASRFGFDCNLFLGSSTLFLYLLITALEKEHYRYYILCGIVGGLTLYSYALSYVILPLFLIFTVIILILTKKFHFLKWLAMAAGMGLLALPLILVQIVNYFDLPEYKLGPFTITKMVRYRASEISGITKERILQFLKCFFEGDSLAYDSIPGIWNLYKLSAVFFVIGFCILILNFVICLTKRNYAPFLLLMAWLPANVLLYVNMDTSVYRINGLMGIYALFTVYGLWKILKFAKNHYLQAGILLAALGIYGVCFLFFGRFYYGSGYRDNCSLTYFGTTYTDGIQFIENDSLLKEKKTYMADVGIFYAASVLPNPKDFDVIGDVSTEWGHYYFGALCEIDDNYNYLVKPGFEEYCDALLAAGFTCNEYNGYKLYYKRQ